MKNYQRIADWYINKGIETGNLINPMKLQKLIYFTHGWCLAVVGESVIDEFFYAWKYGPILQPLYFNYKKLGLKKIDKKQNNQIKYTKNEIDLLNFIWERYSGFDCIQLSRMAHTENSPWQHVMKNYQYTLSNIIPNELIKNYFSRLYEKTQLSIIP